MISVRLRAELAQSARIVVRQAHRGIPPIATKSPDREEEFVASLVIGGVQDLAASWRPLLARAGVSVRIGGVFIHKRPFVRFPAPLGSGRLASNAKRCELGDLLLVHEHLGARNASRRAVLIQAKMRWNKVDPIQDKLYRSWPNFRLEPRTLKPNLTRIISPNDAGSRYGFISSHKALSSRPWILSSPASPNANKALFTVDLGLYLAELLWASDHPQPRHQRGRSAWPPNSSSWSILIDDLLSESHLKRFTLRSLFGSSKPYRSVFSEITLGSGRLLPLFFGGDDSSFGAIIEAPADRDFAIISINEGDDWPPGEIEGEIAEGSGGISTLLVQTRSE